MELNQFTPGPATNQAYVYRPLADGWVRFLELFPGIADEPLRCRIYTSSLDHALPYEALSYVWGPQEPLRPLQCIDDQPSFLQIGPNLHSALLHLRLHPETGSNPRVLWVDLICINQKDLEERATQVLLMRLIYGKCENGLIWLGEEDSYTKDAFDCARYIWSNNLGFGDKGDELFILERNTWFRVLGERLSSFKSPSASAKDLRNYLNCLMWLSDRTWFNRAWTFQEAILPLKVSLVCGTNRMPLEYLAYCKFPIIRLNNANLSENANLVLSTREQVKHIHQKAYRVLLLHNLEEILVSRRGVEASDPRDIIFSLLGLFPPSMSRALAPSYSTSVKDVFIMVAKYDISVSRTLRILCSVESPKHLEGDAFPSWVPDWRVVSQNSEHFIRNRNSMSEYSATRGSWYIYDPTTDIDKLQIHGISIGVINQTKKIRSDFCSLTNVNLPHTYVHTNQPITTAIRQAQLLDLNFAHRKLSYIDPLRKSLAIFYDLEKEPSFHMQNCNQCHREHITPNFSLEQAERNLKAEPSIYYNVQQCKEVMSKQEFFTTNSSHIGFGPKETQIGDHIFLLIGSHIPFVLRPAGSEWTLVGACYVHGIMHGEALHPGAPFNPEYYPGSDPGGVWDFTTKVDSAKWYTLTSDGKALDRYGNAELQTDFILRNEPANASSVHADDEMTKQEFRRFLLVEERKDPVVIKAQKIILI